MKFKVVTLGCKVNSYESEAVINDLINKGYTYSPNGDVDVIIINTCTVTQTSDQKSRQTIRREKTKNPNAIVVAMGCYAQLSSVDASSIADIVIGTHNRSKIAEIIDSYVNSKLEINNLVTNIFDVTCYEELKVSSLLTHTRGFIKIQDGCENYCSYCAIPFSRGKIRSRKVSDVIDEINRLTNSGTKEIIISGINTGTYGKDLGNITLAGLIERIMEETTLYRLRVSSIELMEVSDELIDVFSKYPNRIAHHFHIPLQGGSDSVLKRMNRKYLTGDYLSMINKIRERFPDVAITTDLLAGFVGETSEEFEECVEFIQKIGFSGMHIFPYSRRKNTAADNMSGHLDPKIKNERTHILLDIANKMKNEYEQKFIGKTFDIITEQVKNGYYIGHTSNYLEVYVKDDGTFKDNMIVNVKIVKIDNNKIYAIKEDNNE